LNSVIQITTATTGTVTAQDTKQDLVIVHDAAALTLTIQMPASPVDGQTVIVTTSGGITALTLSAAVGTIVSALSTLGIGSTGRYIYSAVQNKWFRF